MNKNTIVGWIVLLGLLFLAFCGFAALAAAIDSQHTVTCVGDAYNVTCNTR